MSNVKANNKIGQTRRYLLPLTLLVSVALLLWPTIITHETQAQTPPPILISEETSTRALAFDSITRQREPFTAISTVKFGGDSRTRVMLFAMNLKLQTGDTAGAVTAEAEDGAHQTYSLSVEYIGDVPERAWATSIVVALNESMTDLGDVLVRIKYRGVESNRVRLGIGHIGDGPPDDPGAVPTPGSEFPSSVQA